MSQTEWIKHSVQQLVASGHRLAEIGEYTIDQFLEFLDAVERKEAVSRMANVIDLSVVLGSVFGGKALESHLDSLRKTTEGE